VSAFRSSLHVIHAARLSSFDPFVFLSRKTVSAIFHNLLIVSAFLCAFLSRKITRCLCLSILSSNRHLSRSLELAFAIFLVRYPSKSRRLRDLI
jgi:hypothetical protein